MNKILIERDREGSYGIGPGGWRMVPGRKNALFHECMEFVNDVFDTRLKISV